MKVLTGRSLVLVLIVVTSSLFNCVAQAATPGSFQAVDSSNAVSSPSTVTIPSITESISEASLRNAGMSVVPDSVYADPDSQTSARLSSPARMSTALFASSNWSRRSKVNVSISPTSTSLQAGTQKQFTASVSGTANTGVTWSASGGTISSTGLYTAPSVAGSYVVRATSVANYNRSASATVKVTAAPTPPPITISVSPTSSTLQTGGTQQFAASVTGTTNTAVTWTATGGSVSSTGLYTAPATAGTYSVRATSAADTSKYSSATIAVTTPPAPITISVSPTSSILQTGASQQFAASVTGTSNTAVTWSTTGGSVSSTGLYTAPTVAGTYTVRATSAADISKYASAAVTINSPAAQIAVSPTSVSFGSIVANTTKTLNVTISNSGGSSLSVTGASVTGATFNTVGAAFPFTLPAGQSATLGVSFAPTIAGTFSGSLTVASTASNTPAPVTLAGTATNPSTLVLSASPISVPFGNVLVGNNSTQTITLSNTGNTSVSVSSANFTGGVFNASVALPMTIAAGTSKSVNVNFTPDNSGPYSGSVSFVSNATNSPASVSLSGTGVAPVQHSVDLSWVGSTSTSVVGYYVYRSSASGGPYNKLNTSAAPTTNYTDASVQSGVAYYYVVTAVDGSGMESSYSNQSMAAVPTP